MYSVYYNFIINTIFLYFQITKLQKQSSKLKERELKEESLKQKEKQFSTLKNKHRSALTELLGSMPEKDFVLSLKKLESSLNSEVNTLKKNLNKKQTQVSFYNL